MFKTRRDVRTYGGDITIIMTAYRRCTLRAIVRLIQDAYPQKQFLMPAEVEFRHPKMLNQVLV